MAIELETISGALELKDEYSSSLGLANAALSNFSHEVAESFEAVAEAGALVVATFTAIGAAILSLGEKGSEILDVERTFEHFSGSADAAAESLEKMRAGTKNTVGDFDLLKNSARLLSAGVKLSAEDFGTLTEASFVLQNRGLGKTSEILQTVSDALVTGRVKAVQRMVGIVDSTDAEEEFAKSLGVTSDQLSKTGHAEATRTAILKLLNDAVADAGETTRDFKENIEAGEITLENWEDDLAKSVASSSVFAAALNAVGEGFTATFGTEHADQIKGITRFLEDAVDIMVNIGLGAIEVARIFNVAWSSVKTVVLGVETVIFGLIAALGEAVVAGEEIALKLHLVPEEEVLRVKETQVAVRAMTVSLAEQTAEAAKGVIGQSDFDHTLDQLGGTLFHVKDAMADARKETDAVTESGEHAAKGAHELKAANDDVTNSFVNRQKVEAELWKIEEKSLAETATAWEQYFALRAKNTGTTLDAQKAAIEAGFAKEVESLNAQDRNYNNHYEALRAKADEALRAVGLNWDSVKDKSRQALEEAAEAARRLYDTMIASSLDFSRDVLDEQLAKVHAAEEAAKGMGQAFVDAHAAAAAAAATQAAGLKAVEEAARRARDAANAAAVTTDITKANLAGTAAQFGLGVEDVFKFAGQGFSFTEIMNAIRGNYAPKNPHGPRIQGFAEGGTVLVGEQGPEVVRLPFGSQVFPTGSGPSGGDITNHIYINDTMSAIARRVADEIMRTSKQSRLFGAA